MSIQELIDELHGAAKTVGYHAPAQVQYRGESVQIEMIRVAPGAAHAEIDSSWVPDGLEEIEQ